MTQPVFPEVVPFPEKVMVQTISRCNASCRFCPYPKVSDSLEHGTMDEGLFQRIIDECGQHPGEVQRLMLYLMNEPLLDPAIIERINRAKERNPRATVHILTNGSLLTEKRGDAIIDSALDWIGISIHGFSPEVYKSAMGLSRDVTYSRVNRFLEKALQRRGPEFVMVTFNGGGPVTSEERDAEINHFRQIGVKRISFFGQSISRAGNVDEAVVSHPRHETIQGCRSIWWPEMMHILWNGDVILCCMDWRRERVVGNIRDRSLAEFWTSDTYRRTREVVAGKRPLPAHFPCSRCEEAIVEPLVPITTVDMALVVLPCAVMDSDASTVPGVQSALRRLGVSETLVDLSERVYQRMDHAVTHLWHRAGHGVVHHGDGSAELMRAVPDEVEWCVQRSREIPADHLLFLVCGANQALALEVVRRIKERDPGRFLLMYGTVPRPAGVVDEFGIPYLQYRRRMDTAVWAAQSIGRDVQAPKDEPEGDPARRADAAPPSPSVTPDPPHAPEPFEPPWRPPGWEGTGAGMVEPAPEESLPSALARAFDRAGQMVGTLAAFRHSPLLAMQELRRGLRSSIDALFTMVLPRSRAVDICDAQVSGVPGSMDLGDEAETEAELRPCSGVEPSDAGPSSESGPASDGETPLSPPSSSRSAPAAEAAPADPSPDAAEGTVVSSSPPEVEPPCNVSTAPPPIVSPEPACDPGPMPPRGPIPVPASPWQNRPDHGRPIDIILGTCPPWGFTNPPTSLGHLAGYARHRGYGVEVLDLNVDLYHRLGPEWQLLWHVENKNYWSNATTFSLLCDLLGPHLDEYADLIASHPAPLVGLSVVDPKERATIELIRRVKARCPEKRFLLGGPACVTPEYRQIFIDSIPELIDGYAMGEGEAILVDAIEAVRAGRSFEGIPGIFIQRGRDQSPLPYTRRKRLLPLDLVPFPLYEDFLLDRYQGDELIVEWSRGCIGSCTFCKGKMIDGKYRTHSAEAIVESLRHYTGWLKLRKFTVCDPVINGDVEVMATLCRLIPEAGLDVQWRGEAIPHRGQSRELLQAMRAAGCTELQLGVESGSDRVLGLMNKARMFSAADAGQVVRDAHDAGIRTALFIIIGFPGEGEAEFLDTFNFVKDNAAYIDELKSINALHIITDTPIHIRKEKYGLVLPEMDYHFRWSTVDGTSTLQIRNDRIRRLKALCDELGIFVRETNLAEGKHRSLEEALGQPGMDRGALLSLLKTQVNSIQSV